MKSCRICYEEKEYLFNSFQSPCNCKGSIQFIHSICLENLCIQSCCNQCKVCLSCYKINYKDLILYILFIFFILLIIEIILLISIWIIMKKYAEFVGNQM